MGTEVEQDYFGSLPVPSVQDLSAKVEDVPDRYVRPEFESELVCTDATFEIPVVDLSRILDEESRREEMAKLHKACEEWGFFQLINHGSEEAVGRMKNDVEEFFKQPLEAKKAYAQKPNSAEGYGQAFVVSEDQKLDWGDMYFVRSLPARVRNMSFWPEYPTTFKETLEIYSSAVKGLSLQLLALMAENLGLEAEQLTSMFEDISQALRMNYYPPCPQADKVVGISPHSDATGLTLLIQTNNVQGLQVRKNGMWIPVNAIPGGFIINIGDLLEVWSNGKYKSIEHRVVVNPNKERLSVAGFHGPNEDAIIGPLPDLVKKDGAANYKSLDTECNNSVSDPSLISNGSETVGNNSISDLLMIRNGSETATDQRRNA
ncbi:hypothetical protein Syun_018286 [Stephania yunnanensis]|uniref:Fe2OG dioxygenase domain-containing protein n=1 Tax=Stephania yunnanensis TaxID=152371 RepID=A0AAP0NW56_9MAGN